LDQGDHSNECHGIFKIFDLKKEIRREKKERERERKKRERESVRALFPAPLLIESLKNSPMDGTTKL
jgi:hypothetical protein